MNKWLILVFLMMTTMQSFNAEAKRKVLLREIEPINVSGKSLEAVDKLTFEHSI